MTYIVAGVVIQDGKVLLIQEAKLNCRGDWYLPAGRMERNESIVVSFNMLLNKGIIHTCMCLMLVCECVDACVPMLVATLLFSFQEAVKREVLEESGFEFEPEALICVESQSYFWVRFTFAGRISGGSLKTPEQADKESLQAGWFPADTKRLKKEVQIRAFDIIRLIDLAIPWFESRPFSGLPVAVGHVSSSQRLVLVHDDGRELRVLLAKEEGGTTRLPVCMFSGGRFAENAVDVIIKVRDNFVLIAFD